MNSKMLCAAGLVWLAPQAFAAGKFQVWKGYLLVATNHEILLHSFAPRTVAQVARIPFRSGRRPNDVLRFIETPGNLYLAATTDSERVTVYQLNLRRIRR